MATQSRERAASGRLNPVTLEVIEGSVRSAELEIEAAVERTARSPMIRDQHDYRVALFDRRGRKLTGRSYSALVEPVLERFDIDAMQPGDVFFFNDPYQSAGGIGHVPDLCTTVPIFADGRVIAFAQVFGHHDDVGGMVPGSLPTNATSIYQEGLLVPPLKLYDAGRPNEGALAMIERNSRLPDHLRGDIDAEIGACLVGSRRIVALAERYGAGVVEEAFDELIAKCTRVVREELLPKIADGVYHWEDYVENDGVGEPRLHALRMTMTKTADKLVLDFNGTDPQARGPINWATNFNDGRFAKKWIGPILRNLADTPERAAEIDINEGICDVIDIVFPPPGTLVSPRFPAPVGMRFFTFLRVLGIFAGCLAKATGGRMPADQETIRIWGIHGSDEERFFLFREVLGGGSGGRWYADGSDVIHIVPNSRNLPAEFSETRFPILVEQLGLKQDSGGPGQRRGGLGYDKRIRALRDVKLLSNADRSILNTYGLAGGRAGGRYAVSVQRPDADAAEPVPGLADDVDVPAGSVIRIVTTGGGGWGDPLRRDPEELRLDVWRGVVSPESAERDYGVVLTPGDPPRLDLEATAARRAELAAARAAPRMFDRGAGYEEMLERAGPVRRPSGWDDPDAVDADGEPTA